MDLRGDSGTLPNHTTVLGGPALEQELTLSSAHCQTESGGTILLQWLEFKTHLLEAVEELHIRRDAETRFEDQISKLVLEKQELEWEKESLQHQTATVANQHTESLINVKKQFQAKIRNIEEEKGKYQVSAELKDKEINNLKEELKSLQLLKYNLEKKSSELEQKLALQSRSKDSHLNQLGEVEKRFSALSRQCAMVKQAHEKLEQNVDEAIKRNKKLTSTNNKQEATIVSLKKELEEVSKKLIKAKMSAVRHDKSHSPTGSEQRIQQLHQKLNMETGMNKKLMEENEGVRAEKQEVMRSLQHTQQLLLSQTQTVSRVELELQKQREQYQALKREHEVMREKSKATEDKVARLMESYAASKTSWDKEKAMLLDRIKSEQQGLRAVNEAYDKLHQKHTELSSQAKVQTQHIYELAKRDSSQSLSVSTSLLPTLMEDVRGEETLDEPIFSSEPPSFGSLQHLASTQTRKPDCLEDAGAVTKLVATGSAGGQDTPNHHQQSESRQSLNPSNLFTCSLTNNKLFSLCSLSVTTGSDSSMLHEYMNNSNTNRSYPGVVSDLIHSTSAGSDDGLLINKGSCVNNTFTASSPEHKSADGSEDLISKDRSDVGMSEKKEEEEGRNEEQKCSREEIRGEDVREGKSAGETRRTLMAQTTDRADRRQDSKWSTEDTGDTKQPETETKDRAEGEGIDGAEERGKTGPQTPETQIPAQTATDTTTEKSDTQQVVDSMDTEPPLAACEPSDCSQSLSQKVRQKDADSSHVDEGYKIRREAHAFCPDEHQSVSHGSNVCHDESQNIQVFEKPMEEKLADKSAANISTELNEPLNHSSICSSQTNTAPLAALLDNNNSIQELETTTTQTQPDNPSNITSHMKQTDETCVTYLHLREEYESPEVPQSQISEQEQGQLRSVVTSDEDGDSHAFKKKEAQSNEGTCEVDACQTAQEPAEKSALKDAPVDIMMDTVDLESEVETGVCQELMKNDKVGNSGHVKTTNTHVHPSHENDASPETSSTKCNEQFPAKEMLLEDTNESSLPSNKTYRSSFGWHSTQIRTGSPTLEQNTSGPGGLRGYPSSSIPMFLKSKHNKVPLVITRASDLLNASSVSGTAASARRRQQGEWKATGEMCRETATADTESRASLSISSFPVSTSSNTVSKLWLTAPGCSRAPAPSSSESDWELSFSQEKEDHQSSFRAQISKIEEFLNAERLRLPKRRRTDN